MPPQRPARWARNQGLTMRKGRPLGRPFLFFRMASHEARESLPLRSSQIEAIEVHHLGPRRHEIPGEFLLRVRAPIDLCEGAELRLRTKGEVDAGAGPLDRIRLAVAALIRAVRASGLPLRAHVEQVDEEVIRQRARL